MRRLRGLTLSIAVALPILALPPTAAADGPLIQVSGASPLTPGCAGPQFGYNYFGSEVEPWLAINPVNPNNLVGAWQQDRWSNGGAQGLVAGVSQDGGATWTVLPIPGLTICSGGAYERASDAWVTFSPNGVLHQISLSFNSNDYANAILVSRSMDGGFTWSTPVTLRYDDKPDAFNDKESITADPNNPDYVYATWDRLKVPPGERSGGRSVERAASFVGPTWFSRTTDGGLTWEESRVIFDPGPHDQTIGNQIMALPSGELIDLMNLIQNQDNSKKNRGMNVAIIRSDDRGETWSKKPIVIDKLLSNGVFEPSSGWWIRSGDIIPEGAVDPSTGNLYMVWQDARFTGYDQIAFSMSSDGGFTWSAPIRINKSPAGVQAFTPSVKVNANGTVGVTYYDFRNNTAHGGAVAGGTDQFLVTCDGNCSDPANWQEKRVTVAAFDIRNAPWAGGLFVGDYEGLATAGADFLTFFSMPHAGDPSSVFFRRMSPPAAAPIAAIESGLANATPAEPAGLAPTPGAMAFGIGTVGPNPSADGRFSVRFTLPTASSASLELLDVTGRRVARREVGSLGIGEHTLELTAGQRVPPGLYMVRLTQGDRVATSRAAVLN